MRTDYYFGVEIELIATPRKVSHPLQRNVYYEKLAKAVRNEGLFATADNLDEGYRKHPEHYNKWWITKDGSLGNPQHPQSTIKLYFLNFPKDCYQQLSGDADDGLVPLEAVSPVLSTNLCWETTIGLFWDAVSHVFRRLEPSKKCGSHIHVSPMPEKRFTLVELQHIAFGIVCFEPYVDMLLPRSRSGNKYCKPNTQHSYRLLIDYDDEDDLPAIWERIQGLDDEKAVRNYMQYARGDKKDRYVLWNFDNILSGRSGTIEFRGGCGLRGPVKTRQWVSFVVAFIHLCLTTRDFQRQGLSEFWEDILEAAEAIAVKDNLPNLWDIMFEELLRGGSYEEMADDLDDLIDDNGYSSDSSFMSKSDSEYSDSDSE